ncbi:ABC transporter substrate-binding protein [Salibacterium aidingense]|uniref:ABC transporter substrate-binding protein n=1 Tax=Salibacterium aidingense TaxID=384933 RepID=UPI003BDC4574
MKIKIPFILFTLFIMLTACGLENNPEEDSNEDSSSDSDNSLIVAQQSDTTTLDPQKQGDMPSMNVLINMFDTLLTSDEDNNVAPALATDWEATDDKTWEFQLRDDVTFHNGEEFNAETVKFSIERLLDPETQSPIVELSNVEEVNIVDDYTVEIVTETPDPILPNKLTLFGGVMVPKEYIEEEGEEHFAENPVGTGPFQYDSWQKDSEVVMDAYEDYWQGAPKVDELTFRVIPDDSNLASALTADEIDIAANISPDVASQLSDTENVNIDTEQGIRTFFINLDADDEDSPLHEKKVRQALNYAVDVDVMIDSVLGGNASKVPTIVPQENFGFDDSITPYEYDPEKAKELLAEAGYEDGFDIEFNANNLDSNIVQVIAAQLEDVGVNAEIELMDSETFISNISSGDVAPMYFNGNTGWTLDAMSNFQSFIRSDRRYNRWDNEEADKLVDIEEQTIDSDARQEAFTELQEIIKEEAPFIFLYQKDNLYGVRDDVNWDANSIGVLRMYNAAKQ